MEPTPETENVSYSSGSDLEFGLVIAGSFLPLLATPGITYLLESIHPELPETLAITAIVYLLRLASQRRTRVWVTEPNVPSIKVHN